MYRDVEDLIVPAVPLEADIAVRGIRLQLDHRFFAYLKF